MTKPTKGKGHNGGGMVEFTPTDDQRRFVFVMAGFKMSWDEIASVIINPRTKHKISKETLGKAFEHELAIGKQRLKTIISSKYMERLNQADWNAISFGLRHIYGYRDNDLSVAIGDGSGDGRQVSSLQVTFVDAQHEDDEPPTKGRYD